jgi:hypothetical protein
MHNLRRSLLATTAVAGLAVAVPAETPSNTSVLPNPLVTQRADPWVHRADDGFYYFTATVPEYDRLELRRAPWTAWPPPKPG